jgi:hypothetical protein
MRFFLFKLDARHNYNNYPARRWDRDMRAAYFRARPSFVQSVMVRTTFEVGRLSTSVACHSKKRL